MSAKKTPQRSPLSSAMSTPLSPQTGNSMEGKAAWHSELTAIGKVNLSSKEMKSMALSIGAIVRIESRTKENMGNFLFLRAWPSKLLAPGTISIHKAWHPTFHDEPKTLSIAKPNFLELVLVPAKKAVMSITPLNSEANQALLKQYLIACLRDIPIRQNHRLLLSWKGFPITVTIGRLDGPVPSDTNEKRMIYYMINDETFISASSLKIEDSAISMSRENAMIANDFIGGYSTEVALAKSVLQRALGDTDGNNGSNDEYGSTRPKGVLIMGPAGTGKTMLMRELTRTIGDCTLYAITHDIILKRYVGEAEAELQRVFYEAKRTAPSCILLDDIDLICPHRDGRNSSGSGGSDVSDVRRRFTSCMLTLIDGMSDGRGVFIIATSALPNNIDQALRRPGRLDVEIELGVPSAEDREQILACILQQCRVVISRPFTPVTPVVSVECVRSSGSVDEKDEAALRAKEVIKRVARSAHGMVGADLLQLVKEAAYIALRRSGQDRRLHDLLLDEGQDGGSSQTMQESNKPGEKVNDVQLEDEFSSLSIHETAAGISSSSLPKLQPAHNTISESDLTAALKVISPSAIREIVVEVPNVKWTDIGGMNEVKQALKEVVEWPFLYPEVFDALHLPPPRGVLLYGPPGCSKTLMAKALATESAMNFLAVRGPELLSKWLGESEKAIQTLFRRARAAAPCIVFFDEIDALACKRGDSSAGVNDRVLSQLLTELDGSQALKHVVVIAATNRPDMLDRALTRPGRIDRKIYVPPPDELSREKIFEIQLSKMPLLDDVLPFVKTYLVSATEGFSGAEVVAVCTEAAMLAIDDGKDWLTCEYLEKAVKATTPQITESMLSFYRTMQSTY